MFTPPGGSAVLTRVNLRSAAPVSLQSSVDSILSVPYLANLLFGRGNYGVAARTNVLSRGCRARARQGRSRPAPASRGHRHDHSGTCPVRSPSCTTPRLRPLGSPLIVGASSSALATAISGPKALIGGGSSFSPNFIRTSGRATPGNGRAQQRLSLSSPRRPRSAVAPSEPTEIIVSQHSALAWALHRGAEACNVHSHRRVCTRGTRGPACPPRPPPAVRPYSYTPWTRGRSTTCSTG